MSLRALLDLAKMRWHVGRDYHDLKPDIGLGHYALASVIARSEP
jgi:SRSO17 transposase